MYVALACPRPFQRKYTVALWQGILQNAPSCPSHLHIPSTSLCPCTLPYIPTCEIRQYVDLKKQLLMHWCSVQKPNSWTYNFFEVSRKFSYWRFLYGFLKPLGRGYGFLSGFPPFSFTVYSKLTVEICKRLCEFEEICKRMRQFEEIEISRQSCKGDCEYQGGKLLSLLSGFLSRIRPQAVQRT